MTFVWGVVDRAYAGLALASVRAVESKPLPDVVDGRRS